MPSTNEMKKFTRIHAPFQRGDLLCTPRSGTKAPTLDHKLGGLQAENA